MKKPYKEIIDLSWGDLQRAGVKPLSFVRQVICDSFPFIFFVEEQHMQVLAFSSELTPHSFSDVCLQNCIRKSFVSSGSYTATAGIPEIVHRVAEFITRQDGGIPSHPENIYISAGSQRALTNIVTILMNRKASPRTGILTPVPCYNIATLSMMAQGATVVPYYLNQEHSWELQIEELHRALESAQRVCNPVALYVINPGNPTGHVQSRKSMQEVIHFVSERSLFLLADEIDVYQDCFNGEKTEFVLMEMGPPLSDTVELASFHSASKGFMGECGLRDGYVELVNLDHTVMKYIYVLFSKDSSAPVLGQFALDLMANPPQPGDPSYPLYNVEMQNIRTTVADNAKRAVEVVNNMLGFCCQPVEGGAFAFPQLHLPPKAIEKAEEMGMKPDTYYCTRLYEESGVLVRPGSEYGQKEGTYHIRYIFQLTGLSCPFHINEHICNKLNCTVTSFHFTPFIFLFSRFCIATSADIMEELLKRLSIFHTQFMEDFS
uniref:alanine transaminase n=1 Tax=Echeneis naucrates TaxID=173247 RepID=A0A665W029_ECHNA